MIKRVFAAFKPWYRYPFSLKICVKLQKLAPERTSLETTSYMTSYSLSKLHSLASALPFLMRHLVRKPSVLFTRQSETHSEYSTRTVKLASLNLIRSRCAEIQFVPLPTMLKGTSYDPTIM